jgi:hypothetical protein
MSLVGSLRGVQAIPEPCNSNSIAVAQLCPWPLYGKDLTPAPLTAAMRSTGRQHPQQAWHRELTHTQYRTL